MFQQARDLRKIGPAPTTDGVLTQLVEEYGSPESTHPLKVSLSYLEAAFEGLEHVSGKRVLDLGCGCIEGAFEVDYSRGTWAPWLVRAVTHLGGEAVGLDIGRVPKGEKFEYHRVDLRREDSLQCVADRRFDAINCSNLFSSPHLVFRLDVKASDERMRFCNDLKSRSEQLLKPGGRFIRWDEDLHNW